MVNTVKTVFVSLAILAVSTGANAACNPAIKHPFCKNAVYGDGPSGHVGKTLVRGVYGMFGAKTKGQIREDNARDAYNIPRDRVDYIITGGN